MFWIYIYNFFFFTLCPNEKHQKFQDVHIFNILKKNWLRNITKYNWNLQFPTFQQWCLEDLFSLIIIIFLKISPNKNN
jgi:hypothetical protein